MRVTIPRLAAALLLPAIASTAAFAAEQPTLQENIAITSTIKEPIGALMTFHIINNCVRVRRGESMSTYDDGQRQMRPMTADERLANTANCAGLTEELASARMDYLDRALRANVDGAAAAFLLAGPDGEPALLAARPKDPKVVEWKRQAVGYLAEAALRGDVSSLIHLQAQQAQPEHLGAPLELIFAADATVQYITRQNTQQQPTADLFADAARLLTPDQLARAQARAHDMMAAYDKRRETPPANAAR